ncbi:MAG: NAD(P)-binding domain-containing protein [Acidimicrobiales bacterium]
MDVGIIGGTGPAGRALGARLAAAGATVVLGSREPARATAAAQDVAARWPARDLAITGAANVVGGGG